jgi:hypothetical protein
VLRAGYKLKIQHLTVKDILGGGDVLPGFKLPLKRVLP